MAGAAAEFVWETLALVAEMGVVVAWVLAELPSWLPGAVSASVLAVVSDAPVTPEVSGVVVLPVLSVDTILGAQRAMGGTKACLSAP